MPGFQTVSKVNDLVILPLHIQSTKPQLEGATHYLYIQQNNPKVPTKDTPRELFIVNIPIDSTELHIRSLFSTQLGGSRVEHVSFDNRRAERGTAAPITNSKKRKRGQDEAGTLGEDIGQLPRPWDRGLHRSGSTATVTFVDKPSADLALKEVKRAIKARKKIIWAAGVEEKTPRLGSARYVAHQKLKYPSTMTLQASVDEYMAAFAEQEAERTRMLAKQRAEPDEDGFITVVRGGRTGPAREEAVKAKEEELKQREKNRVKSDFYRFQVREVKKQDARRLVNEFEEDRKRVDDMRRRKQV